MQPELQQQNVSLRRTLHGREVQQDRVPKVSGTQGGAVKSPATNWRGHDDVKKECLHDASESERQAAISAQELAAVLKHEMSQETTAFDSWKNEIKKDLQKRWRSKARREWQEEALCIAHLFLSDHQEWIVRNPLRRQKQSIHHVSGCDPQKAIRGNIPHRLLVLYRTRDQLPMKVPQTGKKQRNSNLNLARTRLHPVLGKFLFAEK